MYSHHNLNKGVTQCTPQPLLHPGIPQPLLQPCNMWGTSVNTYKQLLKLVKPLIPIRVHKTWFGHNLRFYRNSLVCNQTQCQWPITCGQYIIKMCKCVCYCTILMCKKKHSAFPPTPSAFTHIHAMRGNTVLTEKTVLFRAVWGGSRNSL